MKAELKFIGEIATPYQVVEECPNNINFEGPKCQITVFDDYQEGLAGLKVGQHILVMYWLDGAQRDLTKQSCRNGTSITGTFSLRSPRRPNPIGVAVLPIEEIGEGTIAVRGLDCLNGTKLIDIKPAIYREGGAGR
ncbi:tRNA (N6-threonylcarbamoyladenosine(37)-N6)-methyltransferase TrmO [Vibrio sp. HN007]|uniref:tRNA (N6-threonylcarbamoyladenosine(37)-N6)-methyltransferase TrmO n=1 Tax=Vibrio iocasae TaxID=3098914 RepID=UPI0035D3F584